MTTPPDALTKVVADWAENASEREAVRITPAMLRAKHMLALEDKRRRRASRVQAIVVSLPVVLLVAALRPWLSVAVLADRLVAAPLPTSLAAAAGTLCLVAYVGTIWATE